MTHGKFLQEFDVQVITQALDAVYDSELRTESMLDPDLNMLICAFLMDSQLQEYVIRASCMDWDWVVTDLAWRSTNV